MKALPLFLACAFLASPLWAEENWPEFRHLAFQPPKGRETLSE